MELDLDVKIQNFGKISDANIKLKPFTIIGGVNSSGKSFITKALYCFFKVLNQGHLSSKLVNLINEIDTNTSALLLSIKDDETRNRIMDFLQILHVDISPSIKQISGKSVANQVEILELERFQIDRLDVCFETAINLIRANPETVLSGFSERALEEIINAIDELRLSFDDPVGTVSVGIIHELENALLDNFQLQDLSEIENYHLKTSEECKIEISDVGFAKFTDEIDFSFDALEVESIRELNEIVLLESPIYWKIKNALLFNRTERLKSGSHVLTGIPQHFYDLIDLLNRRVKFGGSSSPLVGIIDTINDAIGGEIEVTNLGDIYFREKNAPRSVELSSTASGITNIGLIALLLKRHVITKGSILFIDEPEVNLHPSWQKVMVDMLYKMSRSGINVVIASHSMDMMKAVENILEDLSPEEAEKQFAINQLSGEGKSINEDFPVDKKLAALKADLGKPFYDMFMESQW